MADSEIKYFNVKNTSVRLVNFADKLIVPDSVVAIVDDELGINRATVAQDLFLEETDEDSTEIQIEEVKTAAKPVAKAKPKTAATNTPTGAGWSSK